MKSSSRAIPGADSRSATDEAFSGVRRGPDQSRVYDAKDALNSQAVFRPERHLTRQQGREVMWKATGALLAAIAMVISTCASHAEKLYDQGANDTSIKIGNTMPYSGPNSAFAVVGRT